MKDINFINERWDMAKIMADNFRINDEEWDDSDFEWAASCLQMEGYHKQSEGEWERADEYEERYGYLYKCSVCEALCFIGKYCPNCGAKMKGDAE